MFTHESKCAVGLSLYFTKMDVSKSQAATYIVNNGTISETVPYGVVVTTDH